MAVFSKNNYATSNITKKKSYTSGIQKFGTKYQNNGGMLVFPDGARLSYQNITEKNIYPIIEKYSNYLHPDTTGMNSKMKYKLGRLALTFNDGNATIAIGKISSMGFEYNYKLHYIDDNNMNAIYYYPNKNYEEMDVSSGKCIFKSYNALHQLVKMEEIFDDKSNIYEINPETNDIKCITI